LARTLQIIEKIYISVNLNLWKITQGTILTQITRHILQLHHDISDKHTQVKPLRKTA
jgi:hypothetical protein